MSWDLCRGGLKHDEIGLVHPRVSFTSPKSLVPNIYIYMHDYTCAVYNVNNPHMYHLRYHVQYDFDWGQKIGCDITLVFN